MAIQNLEVWARELVNDPVAGNHQRRSITEEEFLNGWGRGAGVSDQQMNQLMYLLSAYASPYPFLPVPYPSASTTPATCIDYVAGGSISETDTPQLYEFYGSTFPAVPYTLTAGWKFIIRTQ